MCRHLTVVVMRMVGSVLSKPETNNGYSKGIQGDYFALIAKGQSQISCRVNIGKQINMAR